MLGATHAKRTTLASTELTMSSADLRRIRTGEAADYEVVIVGAGFGGIGAAIQLAIWDFK